MPLGRFGKIKMLKNFWSGRQVLITGFEGFLGSNLTKQLIDYGAIVTGLDIKINRRDTLLKPQDYKKINVVKGNVANYTFVKNIINKRNIEVIFHLAAEAIVSEGYRSPLKTFRSNIQGTWSLLEACRFAGNLKAIIIASSDKAYGAHEKLPYTENTSLIGRNPYDVSKSCADLMAYSYFHSYGLPVAITRCGNIYGPGDFNFSRIFPDAIRCALTGKILHIRSDGKFTRDYVYVSDIVDGYLLLAENMDKLKLKGEAFNFSDENPITVIDLIKRIYKTVGTRENYKILNSAKYEIPHQYLASGKARKILHWKPKVSLSEGLSRTVSWYRKFISHK